MKYENPLIPYQEIPKYSQVSLQPVELSYKKVLYISWIIAYTALFAILTTLFVLIKPIQIKWLIALVAAVFLIVISVTVAAIEIGFKNKAWAFREKDIQFKKGWLFQTTYIIPFNKVQHCELVSGPIGRKFGLASIRINTASSNNIDISIKGLKQETAEQLKAFIMEKMEGYEHQ
jgi:membrane protein YdbS with pleckstrin-like domain